VANEKLFGPVRLGALELANRIVMAPMTRSRATQPGDVPGDLAVDYYRQRATAGLIISEASQVSAEGKGYIWTPGIHSEAQVAGWRRVVDAVHARGGRMVLQLWHVGRVSHTSLQPDGQKPVAPSAIIADARTYDGKGFIATSEPRGLDRTEIPRIVRDFRRGAANACAAGFDGVEIHAANGYLIEQFLYDGSNRRSDAYGGSIANRARFLAEVIEAVLSEWPHDRVGVRLSPFSESNGVRDSDPAALFTHVVDMIDRYRLAYLFMLEGVTAGDRSLPPGRSVADLRARFRGSYIANNCYDRRMAIEAVENGHCDAVAFGRPFIANPDLVERLRRDATLNTHNPDTLYGGVARGYTDYPSLTNGGPGR
jgi:N-ethylmaleimide reductase